MLLCDVYISVSFFQEDSPTMLCFRWVPIRRNDWFWLRHHIKVGMDVMVEITVSVSVTS